MSFFTTKSTMASFAIFIATFILTNIAQAACNNIPPGTDDPILITVNPDVALGSLTRPDSGTEIVTIATNGTRTLPSELNVGGNEPVDSFNEAHATVTGGAGCVFQITVGTFNGNVSNFKFDGVGSYSLDSNVCGAKGTLDVLGAFEFTIGVSATIDSDATPVGGDFQVIVSYSD